MFQIKDIEIEENVSLKDYNTYKISSSTKYFIKVKSIQGLIDILKYLKEHSIPYFILGAGSNVILDDYFNGAVIKLELLSLSIEGKKVVAEAGVMMGRLAMESINHELSGLEWAINIPGTVGGSINGNAGAYNSEMFDYLTNIKVLDLNTLEVLDKKNSDFSYSYRHTNIKKLNYVVLEGTFLLNSGNKEESLGIIKDRCERRKASQPLDMPSAGSVFKNPEGDHAGRLIEACGLKGKRIGGAEVSSKHANFIVNTGTATSNDIKSLIKLVKEEVKEKFQVDLVLEQEIVDWK